MAAQERAKQTHQGEAVELQPPPQQQQEQQEQEHEQPPPPAFDDDLLMSMDTDVQVPPPSPPPPVYTYSEPQPPPALNAAVHVHGLAPPSMFSVPVAPVTAAVAPPSMSMWDPHAPSAPAMEDLFEDTAVTAPNQMQTNDPTPPSMDDWGNLQVIAMAPPAPTANANTNTNNTTNNNNNNTTSNEMDPAMVEAILGIEGLSNQEKRELLDEQKRIMASIESEKVAATNSTATDRANAFEQRSFSAAVQSVGSATTTTTTTRARVPTAAASDGTNTRTVNLGDGQEVALHGQERTRQAIAEGTAILVQCTCCSNWMQVTETATLMFCPVCQVVSPVVQETGRGEEAAQLKSDQEMAEQLQKEEYKAAGREERKAAKAVRAVQEEQSQSWMEYFGMSTSTTSSAAVRPSSQPPAFAIPAERPRERGELGVSRPPGAGPRTGKPGLSVAHTGEERGQSQTITFSNSYDEHDGLLMNSSGGTRKLPAARVAGQQPLFNCVADSITSAASQAMTAIHTHTLGQDEEGNVHGVDSSGLLAVTNVGRETRYEPLNDGGGGGQGKN
jgi:hypothetical protein